MKHLIIFSTVFCLHVGNLLAQSGSQTPFLPQYLGSQVLQPAHLANMDSTKFKIGLWGNGFLGNKISNLKPVLAQLREGNYITDERKQDLYTQLGDKGLGFQLGTEAGIGMNLSLKPLNLGVYVRNVSGLRANVSNSATVKLLLDGNQQFINQTVSDEQVYVHSQNRWEAGVGIGKKMGNWEIGGRIKAIAGGKNTNLKHLDYSLFTASDAEEVRLDANYELQLANDSTKIFNGWGAGVDIGVKYQLNDKWQLGVSATDVGFISWKGNNYQNDFNTTYQGFPVSLSSLLEGNSFVINTDSLIQIVVPDTVAQSYTTGLGATFMLSGTYQLTEKNSFNATLMMAPNRFAPAYGPLFTLGYQRQLGKSTQLGIQSHVGGYDGWGIGILAATSIPMGNSALQVYYTMDNVIGILGGVGKSAHANVGIGYAF